MKKSVSKQNVLQEDCDESELDAEESTDEEDKNSMMITEEEDSCGRRFNIYTF